MQVQELPKPLIPLNPLQPPRQPRIPKALGQVFFGNPFLSFPEVKEAPAPPAEANAIAKAAPSEPRRAALVEPNYGRTPQKPLYGLDSISTALGQRLDVNV